MRTTVVVNPQAADGRTGARWAQMRRLLEEVTGPVETLFTTGPLDATELTRKALHGGAEQVIAVGGDGTGNEVVNGFFEGGRPINPEAVYAFLTSGTGGDFRKTFGIPRAFEEQVARLARSEVQTIDLGRLRYTGHNGEAAVRFFANVASFGISGFTDKAVNELHWAKRFGGKFAFKWGMTKALFSYRNQPVRLRVDDDFDTVLNINLGAVCNGCYFGGGMHLAPNARPDDGLFDIILVTDVGNLRLFMRSGSIYRGAHLDFEEVTALTATRVTAEPADGADEVLLDVDGEAPGRLPATFEIVPKTIRLRG